MGADTKLHINIRIGGLVVLVKEVSPSKGALSFHFSLYIIHGTTTDAQLVNV